MENPTLSLSNNSTEDVYEFVIPAVPIPILTVCESSTFVVIIPTFNVDVTTSKSPFICVLVIIPTFWFVAADKVKSPLVVSIILSVVSPTLMFPNCASGPETF